MSKYDFEVSIKKHVSYESWTALPDGTVFTFDSSRNYLCLKVKNGWMGLNFIDGLREPFEHHDHGGVNLDFSIIGNLNVKPI